MFSIRIRAFIAADLVARVAQRGLPRVHAAAVDGVLVDNLVGPALLAGRVEDQVRDGRALGAAEGLSLGLRVGACVGSPGHEQLGRAQVAVAGDHAARHQSRGHDPGELRFSGPEGPIRARFSPDTSARVSARRALS